MNIIENNWITNAKDRESELIDYLKWFDTVNDLREYICLGHIDFFNRILTTDMYNFLGNPYEKTSLEIGFGGGRLLNAACSIFKYCYGIDIIEETSQQLTKQILQNQLKTNFTLIHRDNKTNIKDNSIDFVYSFIVFQHFSSINEVENYLKFSNRVLVNKGCGIFYFGRNDTSNEEYICYSTLNNERGCSLLLKKEFAENLVKKYFKIIEIGEVTKKPWINDRSGQFFIKFFKS